MRHRRSNGKTLDHDEIGRAAPGAIVALFFPLTLVFGLTNRKFLPAKFFYDSDTIALRMPVGQPTSDDSFFVMGWLYREFAGANNYPEVQLVQMLLFAALMLSCVPWPALREFGALPTAGVLYALLSSSIYLAQYTKESMVVAIILLLRLLPRHWMMDAIFIAIMCIYATEIRAYWFIIAGMYLIFRIVLPRARTLWWIAPMILVSYLAMAFGLQIFSGESLTSFRDNVAESRIFSQDAQSAIQSYLPGANPVLGGINAWVTLGMLIVPIPLLLDPTPVYSIFFVVTVSLWTGFLVCLRRLVAANCLPKDTGLTRGISMILAVIVAQALFEPDFGSYLRHSLPAMPLFFMVFARTPKSLSKGVSNPCPRVDAPPSSPVAS